MPADQMLETYVLAKILNFKTAIAVAAQIVKPEQFYYEKQSIVYSACVNVFSQGMEVDTVTVTQEIIQLKLISKIGSGFIPEIANYDQFGDFEVMCLTIRDLYMKRETIRLTELFNKQSYDRSIPGYDIVSDIINDFTTMQDKLYNNSTKNIKDTNHEVISKMGDADKIGLSTGFEIIDEQTNGLLAPDLTVIAAGPGEGKSLFALNIAETVSKKHGVLFFSLEMKREQIVERLQSKATGYSVKELRRCEYYHHESNSFKKIDKADVTRLTNDIDHLNLFIHDSGLDSYTDIGAITKSELKRKNIKLVIIDYLQIIPMGDASKKTRDQMIGEVTRHLKLLAMKLNIPIIILSQVNRQKGRKKYGLSDLRESGNIEQDADNVWFIFRPDKHGLIDYEIESSPILVDKKTAVISIAKNRAGSLCELQMRFDGHKSKFYQSETETLTPNENANLPF